MPVQSAEDIIIVGDRRRGQTFGVHPDVRRDQGGHARVEARRRQAREIGGGVPAQVIARALKIQRIEAVAVSLPLTQPIRRSKGVLTTADNVLVRIETGGIVGWGEAGSAPTMTGEFVQSMVAAVQYLTPFLEGAPLDIAKIALTMDANLYGNSGAKAAIEMAAHDALGKSLGKPVYELLGGKAARPHFRFAHDPSGDLAADVAEAVRCKAKGYVAYKIKVGAGTCKLISSTRARYARRSAAGVLVSADANQNWRRGAGARVRARVPIRR